MDWEKIETLYHKGKRLSVTINRVEDYGAFIDLPEGISGYIPRKELSWTGSVLDAREKLNKGDQVDTVVLELDRRHKGIVLSIKKSMENPWPDFYNSHKKGDIVKGKVIRVLEKATFLEIDNSIMGMIPLSHVWLSVEKMEGALLVGDQVQAKILEFNNDKQSVVLSISELFTEEKQSIDIESGSTIGDVYQDALDLMRFRMESKADREIGLSDEAKKLINRILIVEPDKELSLSTATMLESVGFVADYVTKGEEAVRQFREQTYDLVVTALNMPDTDGISIARSLRGIKPELPVIIQTAKEDIEKHLIRLKEIGLHNCILTKPWKLEDLVEFINDAAEGTLGKEPLSIRANGDFDFIDKFSEPFVKQIESISNIEDVLDLLKERTKSSFVIVFSQHLTTLECDIFAASGLKRELTIEEKRFLRFSPVMSVIHNEIEFNSVVKSKRYKYLYPLRKFNSVIGQKINLKSDLGYGLFIFGEREYQFSKTDYLSVNITAHILGAAIERRKLEEIYQKQHKFIITGQLSSALVHELKNEQQTIFNYVDVLKTDSKSLNSGKIKPDEQFLARFHRVTDTLIEMQDKSQTIQRLFLNLLKEKGSEKIELSNHLKDLIKVIKPTADDFKIKIIPPENKIRKYFLNTSRLDQIITNLLMNAIDQISLIRKTTGKVWINLDFVENDDLPIKIEIRDNGPGIHTSHIDKVFDIFFTTKENGSGLGLFISKELVDSMGGKISVKDTIRFGGTTFLLELPCYSERG